MVRCLASVAFFPGPAIRAVPQRRGSSLAGRLPLCRFSAASRGSPVGVGAGSLATASGAMVMGSFSIETTPKLSSRIEKHSAVLPPGTPVYVAAIPGTPVEVHETPQTSQSLSASYAGAPTWCL